MEIIQVSTCLAFACSFLMYAQLFLTTLVKSSCSPGKRAVQNPWWPSNHHLQKMLVPCPGHWWPLMLGEPRSKGWWQILFEILIPRSSGNRRRLLSPVAGWYPHYTPWCLAWVHTSSSFPHRPSYVFRTDALAKSSGMSSTHMTILAGRAHDLAAKAVSFTLQVSKLQVSKSQSVNPGVLCETGNYRLSHQFLSYDKKFRTDLDNHGMINPFTSKRRNTQETLVQ